MDRSRGNFAWIGGTAMVLAMTTAAAVNPAAATHPAVPGATDTANATIQRHLAADYGQLPIRFEPNVGQAPAAVKYLARDAGYRIALTGNAVLLSLRKAASTGNGPADPRIAGSAASAETQLRVRLDGSNAQPRLVAEQQQGSQSNYFIGNDPSKWHSHVANYRAVRYEKVYPGIDWVVYGNPRQLEYDLIVAPQADPGRIRLSIEGADHLALDEQGNLSVRVQEQTLRQFKPVIYQTTRTGERQAVDGRYVLDHGQVALALGDYDHDRQLIIDPVFAYSTYVGGSGNDQANAIAVDSGGDAYIAGFTFSTDFPAAGVLQSVNNAAAAGLSTAFVAKLNAAGTGLLYSTYLGGTVSLGKVNDTLQGDTATAIAVDGTGNAYVAGYTTSTDFPTLNAYQTSNRSQLGNAFVAKLAADGSALMYSTYLGGSDDSRAGYILFGDYANAIAVDSGGNAYVAGAAESTDFPTVNPFQGTNNERNSIFSEASTTGFVTKLNATGNALVYSTYLGGSGRFGMHEQTQMSGDSVNAIAVDSSGSAYVAGRTSSLDFPLVDPIQSSNNSVYDSGGYTAFAAKFNPAGSALLYATYLGGSSGDEYASAIAVDRNGSAYIAGNTSSRDFPTVNPLQATNNAPSRTATAFVSKFNPAGTALSYSTYLGGSLSEQANAIAVSSAGEAYVAGSSNSVDFPTARPLQARNSAPPSSYNGFVTAINAAGSALVYSTYLGGSGWNGDFINALAVDSAGNAYIAGAATSTDFPTLNPLQPTNHAPDGNSNAFVAKIGKDRANP